MQTAEAETATPDQLRRGATLIVTFPLWPLHFPSIPAFNPSGGGGGRARRKQSATAAPQGGKKKERKKEKKIPNPKHTPPLRSPPLSNPSSPPPHHQSPTRFAGCARPTRPRPLRFTGGGGVRERAPATGEEEGGGRWSRAWATSTASGGSSGAARSGRSTSVRAAAPRLVGGFPFFWFFFWWIVFSSGVAESVGCGFAPAGTNVQTNEEVAIKLVSWCDNTHVFAYSTIFLSLFFWGGGGRRGSQLVDWGGSDG